MVGNLMGDFIKGRLLPGHYPAGIMEGVQLHRSIDSFAAANEYFRCSKRRLSDPCGLYRGVMVDLFYDHFLAREWDVYADLPLTDYIECAYRVLREHRQILPERLERMLPALFTEWLPSYREIEGVELALQRMGMRLKRANPLATGGDELRKQYAGLHDDFSRFFPALRSCPEVRRHAGPDAAGRGPL